MLARIGSISPHALGSGGEAFL